MKLETEKKVQQAFESARQFFNTLGVANQTPWIDANGDGRYTPGDDDSSTGLAAEEFFGTSWAYAAGGGWEPPAFEAVTPNQSPPLNTTVTIWVKMLPFQNPQRVWATILPPAAKPLAGQALTDLPRVELLREGTTQRWSAKFGGFDTVGTYVVAHVAQFEGARITQPVYSHLSVGAPANPPPIKAILVSGRAASSTISSQTITLANLAYRVSRHRGYTPSRIRYLSAFGNQDADGDRMNDVFSSANVANLTTALSTWATSDCQRLLIYLVGPGEKQSGRAVFRLSPTEVLTSATVDARRDGSRPASHSLGQTHGRPASPTRHGDDHPADRRLHARPADHRFPDRDSRARRPNLALVGVGVELHPGRHIHHPLSGSLRQRPPFRPPAHSPERRPNGFSELAAILRESKKDFTAKTQRRQERFSL
jgi:hypothetical protein